MKTLLAAAILLMVFVSCKTYKVALPGNLISTSEKLHVKGTGISVFGHKINVEGFGEGRMYSGFTFNSSTDKRLFPLYFDLDRRMNYISNHFSKQIDRTKTKFNFEFASNGVYANTYCMARTTQTSLDMKSSGMNIGLSENYTFDGVIFTNKIDEPWRISFSGSKDIKEGLKDIFGNVRNTNGLLTNDSVEIAINQVYYTNKKNKDGLLKIPLGFEFIRDNKVIAFIDAFKNDIYISKEVDDHTRLILVSAATSVLVKTRAS
ncbi:MAG: hypothetical protein V4717_12280 [Bacteroidota bacterium]